MVLAEVENRSVLERLNKSLKKSSYPHVVHLEGPDKRGIDTAILSRFAPASKPKLHSIPNGKGGYLNSRAILEADFKTHTDEKLSIFAVHFPAPYHPMPQRIQAMNVLNQLAQAKKISMIMLLETLTLKQKRILGSIEETFQSWYVSHLKTTKRCLKFSITFPWRFLVFSRRYFVVRGFEVEIPRRQRRDLTASEQLNLMVSLMLSN